MLSKGKHCEICEDGVDPKKGCTTCKREYWIPDIHKHGACKGKSESPQLLRSNEGKLLLN